MVYFGNVLYFEVSVLLLWQIGVYLAHIYSPWLYSEMVDM